MGETMAIGLACFLAGLAGLAGVLVGAAIVWRLGLGRTVGEMSTEDRARAPDGDPLLPEIHNLLRQHREATAKAHAGTREMLSQWHTQQQHGLAAFAAAQVALLDDFLKSQTVPRADVTPPAGATPTTPSVPRPSLAPMQPRPSAAPSARPPELSSKPLAAPAPAAIEEAPARELSDAEIDALPPDLPARAPPRRRVLPAPKSPAMRRL
ncbi:hypothetical protein RD110_14690 [Rhodoferax koreense]|uniref:Uncharacterized protein n=1 Tax=Rhodoferax koreensis TaxID=1842727 RepID=A0A1P8JWZ9_9BURK|nr:hypothetical protein [Rhodoferax koreense]APW38284.1 hypothetical protein RD110_14690 [Rhodoferax koreense]